MKTLYICGAITSNKHYRDDFAKADLALNRSKYYSINPVLECEAGNITGWTECMKMLIPLLVEADGVALIPSDLPSRGRDLELHIAKELGLKIKTVEKWLALAEENCDE